MSDEVELKIAAERHPQHFPILPDEGGGEDAIQIEAKAYQILDQGIEEMKAAAEKLLDSRREALSPTLEKFDEDAWDKIANVAESTKDDVRHRTAALRRRRERAEEALPDLTDGRAEAPESDIRQFVREFEDEEDRNRRITEIIEDDPAAARALFRSSVPPAVAGFRDREHRANKLEQAYRTHDWSTYKTTKALRRAERRLEAATEELINRAAAETHKEALRAFEDLAES